MLLIYILFNFIQNDQFLLTHHTISIACRSVTYITSLRYVVVILDLYHFRKSEENWLLSIIMFFSCIRVYFCCAFIRHGIMTMIGLHVIH